MNSPLRHKRRTSSGAHNGAPSPAPDQNGALAALDEQTQIETDVTTANALLHLALEAGKAVAWEWDVKTGRDAWFGDLQTIFGLPSTTYRGHVEDFRQRVHPDDRAHVWRAVKDSMEGRSEYVAQFRIVRPDGSSRWVVARGRFYYLPDGEPDRMLGIAVDVTERKAAEEALHRKEAELIEAQRLAGVGSWQWNPETDAVSWSDQSYQIDGRDSNLPAVSYQDQARLYTPESWDRLRHAVDQALRTGVGYELDLETIHPDGTTGWLIARGEAQRDAGGRIVGLRGTVQDITERRRSQDALRVSEERLRLAVQVGRMYAFEWDPASDAIVRSAEFAHILGLSTEPKETTCREMLETVHPEDRARVIAASESATPENPGYQVQYRVLRPDGSVVWLEKNGHAFFDQNGEVQRVLGIVADITERKLAEEAVSTLSRKLIEAQEAERARIARDLHDDIGQRLALVLITLGQVKQAAGKDTGIPRQLDELSTQVGSISRSIHNLSQQLHSATLRHLGVAEAMKGLCRELSKQHRVEIHFALRGVPENVSSDISLCLFRVLQEGLHNALKHSGARHFEVELEGTPDTISLLIRDSGSGFDPKKAMKGSGLGLVSMQERLKLVQGELSIDSQPDRGTEVRARVPFVCASASAVGAL